MNAAELPPAQPAPFPRPRLGYGADAWQRGGMGAVRGATLGPIENSQHPGVGYGTAASDQALAELAAVGCNWVSITPFGRLWDLGTTQVQMDFEAPYRVNREAVVRVIRQARARGLKVLLVPHLWVDTGGWRGEIAFEDEAGWARWFASYTRFVTEWARAAEEGGAEMLSLGVELKTSSGRWLSHWVRLIEAVRREYHGLLTYSANWDEERTVAFWDRIDVVGINAFHPLAERPGADLAEMRRHARRWADELEAWALREGRSVMFTEFGFSASTDPAIRPWQWPENLAAGARIDERAQADGYRALLEAFAPRPWFVGAFVWRYYANPMDASQEPPWGFSPRLREGEAVLREIYAYRWGSDPVHSIEEPLAQYRAWW